MKTVPRDKKYTLREAQDRLADLKFERSLVWLRTMVRLRKIRTVLEYDMHWIFEDEIQRIVKEKPVLKVVMSCVVAVMLCAATANAAMPMTPKLVAKEGTASWYSSKEACGPKTNNHPGCPMANGKSIFKYEAMGAMFCASNDWPLGTILKVTNPKNGKSVLVEVSDRGGFKKYGRVIDLCKKAYRELATPVDNLKGTMFVKIERG